MVSAIGAGVKNVKEGDEVIIQPSGYCGHCHNCRLGMTHYCENSYTTGGDGPEDVRPGSFEQRAQFAQTAGHYFEDGLIRVGWNFLFEIVPLRQT